MKNNRLLLSNFLPLYDHCHSKTLDLKIFRFDKMDYDDELRHDCEITGDPLRPEDAEDIIDDFEAEMEAELDDIVSDASKTWTTGIKLII